jgi:hypothetical protein
VIAFITALIMSKAWEVSGDRGRNRIDISSETIPNGNQLKREQPRPRSDRQYGRRDGRAGGGRSRHYQHIVPDAAAKLASGENEADQGAVDAHDTGASEALHNAGKHKLRQGRECRAPDGGDDVECQPPAINATMAVDIAQRGHRQQADRHRELVGIHHPDRGGRGGVHLPGDRRQGDVGDRPVQHRHGNGDTERDHGQKAPLRRQAVGRWRLVHPGEWS